MVCVILTIAFMAVTAEVFNKTNSMKCSADGENFLFKKNTKTSPTSDCHYSTLIYFICSLTTLNCPMVIWIVFKRSVKNLAFEKRRDISDLKLENDLSD